MRLGIYWRTFSSAVEGGEKSWGFCVLGLSKFGVKMDHSSTPISVQRLIAEKVTAVTIPGTVLIERTPFFFFKGPEHGP